MTRNEVLKDWVLPAITVMTAALAAWVNYSVSTVKTQLDRQQGELANQKAALDELVAQRGIKKLDEDLTFRIYDAVIASLKEGEAKHQLVAKSLVISLGNEPLRTQLLQVFEQSAAPEVRTEIRKVLADERRFEVEQAPVNAAAAIAAARPTVAPSTGTSSTVPSVGGWGKWNVDVFWCESSGEPAKQQADELVKKLRAAGAQGRIRSRSLPDSINAKGGYGVRGFEIRYDANELAQARELRQLAQTIVSGASFLMTESSQATASYLSAFVCPQT